MANLIVLIPALIALIAGVEFTIRPLPNTAAKLGTMSRKRVARQWLYLSIALVSIVALGLPLQAEIIWVVAFLILIPVVSALYVTAVARNGSHQQ